LSCQLIAANPDYPPVEITEDTDFSVWGVVTSVIHQF
jgi:DNA polymerase V